MFQSQASSPASAKSGSSNATSLVARSRPIFLRFSVISQPPPALLSRRNTVMSEFVVSFEGIEFDHKQSKSVQKAIEAAAHKQVESMASSSNAILKDPPPGQDPTVPGPPYGVSPSKPKPGPSGPSGPHPLPAASASRSVVARSRSSSPSPTCPKRNPGRESSPDPQAAATHSSAAVYSHTPSRTQQHTAPHSALLPCTRSRADQREGDAKRVYTPRSGRRPRRALFLKN